MSPASPSILILRSGHTDSEVIARHGDYDRWFSDRMEGLGCRFTVHHVPGAGVPPVAGHDGIIVTGTAAGVLDREPWMADMGRFLGGVDRHGPPVLAVCFGAQLAADAAGGEVERNPRGWEIGTVEVQLTAQGRHDPLFAGLSPAFAVQTTHQDHILRLPPSMTLLAGNEKAPVQAFGRGRLRAVQFHPEASPAIIRHLVALRQCALEADALARGAADAAAARRSVEAIRNGLRATGNGRRILENWVRTQVRGEPPPP